MDTTFPTSTGTGGDSSDSVTLPERFHSGPPIAALAVSAAAGFEFTVDAGPVRPSTPSRAAPSEGTCRGRAASSSRSWASKPSFKALIIGEMMMISSLCFSTSIESGGLPNA
jgi:hypothetical protein